MNTKTLVAAVLAAGLSLASAAFAGTILLPDTGWQYDQVNTTRGISQNSAIELIIPAGDVGTFSLTDGFIPGDLYRVTVGVAPHGNLFSVDSVIGGIYPTPFVNNLGPYAVPFAADWLDASFSHLQLSFTQGTWYLDIRDTHNEGLPAGFGERLDLFSAIPEASTWAMLGLGFAGIGFVALSRRRRGSRYVL